MFNFTSLLDNLLIFMLESIIQHRTTDDYKDCTALVTTLVHCTAPLHCTGYYEQQLSSCYDEFRCATLKNMTFSTRSCWVHHNTIFVMCIFFKFHCIPASANDFQGCTFPKKYRWLSCFFCWSSCKIPVSWKY